MKINQVAKLSGITVRTLHYYDEIGILKPSVNDENGYRDYSEENLETLQQILFLRELEFSLVEIKEIIQNKNFNRNNAIENHKELLIQKRNRLDDLIKLCEKTLKGEKDMSFNQFDMKKIEEYKKGAKEKYGDSIAYKESEEKTKNYTEKDYKRVHEETNEIFKKFSNLKHLQPSDENVKNLVKEWQDYITDNFYTCTDEILQGLGEMYVQDENFKKNIDKQGEGTAHFTQKAIEYYILNKN